MKRTISIFFIIYINIFGQDISFLREDINFRLNNKYFQVEGYYWFLNPTNIRCEKSIFFPFGDTTAVEIVDSIQVVTLPNNEQLQIFNRSKYGFSFFIDIASYDTIVCRIVYRQKLTSDSVKYILSSTQTWHKPLELAEYKLITDKFFIIKKFSFPPDKIYTISDKKIYYWKKTYFNPKYDIIFGY